jgi:VanZ family protein
MSTAASGTGLRDALPALCRAAFAAGLVAVTVLVLLPQQELPAVAVHDKLSHLLAFGVLAFAGGLGFARPRGWLWCAAALTLWGGTLELLQAAVPGRMPSLADGLANALGVGIGAAAALVVRRRVLAPDRAATGAK